MPEDTLFLDPQVAHHAALLCQRVELSPAANRTPSKPYVLRASRLVA